MKNYFELFSFPTDFKINSASLEKKYLEFQKRFHPDKASSGDIEKSIEINEGYKILSDDFLRASHLLQLQGIDILNDEKAVKVSQATLMEVLDLQEKISEISDKTEIENLRKKINSEFKELIFESMAQLKTEELELAAQILIKAKYFKKSLDDLKIRKQKL
jgi:molecular chaperone HscB